MCEISWMILVLAVVLDFWAGDPRRLPHPIVWMGHAITYFEPKFRRWIKPLFWSGLGFALGLILMALVLSWAVIGLALWIHPLVGAGVKIVLLFYCFSAKTLASAAMDVAKPLVAGDLEKARTMVGYIVGRQTSELDAPGVTRAAVETVAENFVDGFLSPLFFALVFGVPGAVAYKMINTLDSMVGYKNEAYLEFGRAAAKIDDAANFIPARLSVGIISLAAALVSLGRGRQAFVTALFQGRNHKSPNAGFPEAAFAGALEVRMGGPNIYHGQWVEKPYIGERFKDPLPIKIEQACRLMLMSAFISAGLAGFVLFWVQG